MCAYSNFRWTRSDIGLLGVRAPSFATAIEGEANVCTRTMEWTNEKILLFIQAIETHLMLWDTANIDYQ